MKLSPLLSLLIGVSLNLYAQHLTDLKFSKPEAHLMPCVKFLASLIFAAFGKWRSPPVAVPANHRQRRLMGLIGILDAAAYVSFCVGFSYCGTSLSNLVLAAAGQLFTALATRFILKKHLSLGQIAAIGCVGIGLFIRALPASYFTTADSMKNSTNTSNSLSSVLNLDNYNKDILYGICFVLVAAVLYSALGVTYEALMSAQVSGKTPPPYPEILWHISAVGAAGALGYQTLIVLPRSRELLWAPMEASGVSYRDIVLYLVAFGALFNVHMFVQSLVFKSQGALGVSLITAVRGAVIVVVAAALFCSPEKKNLCLNRQNGISAAVTTMGGLAWALAGAQAKKTKQPTGGDYEKRKTRSRTRGEKKEI
jgi:drug/metabolite transporter (DMT)-like permease